MYVSPQIACLNRCIVTLVTFVAVLVIGFWWDGARCGHQPNKPQSQFQFTPRQKLLEIVGHEAESSGIICFSFLFVQTVYPLKSKSWKGPRQQESFLLNLIITVCGLHLTDWKRTVCQISEWYFLSSCLSLSFGSLARLSG